MNIGAFILQIPKFYVVLMTLNQLIRPHCYKIAILGEGGIGKTAICKTLYHKKSYLDTSQTIAVEFHVVRKKIQGTDCTFQIWDLGGQKHFREMGVFNQYCKGVQGAIVCFDLTDIETLYQITKWMEFVPRNIPVILVGTKSDLVKSDYFVKEGILDIQNQYIIDRYIEVTIMDFKSVEKLFDVLLSCISKDSSEKLIKSSTPIAL